MKQIELRACHVTYCDVCGQEITGNYTTMHNKDGVPFHGCDRWSEDHGSRCSGRMDKLLSAELPRANPVVRGVQPMPLELAQRCAELSQWQLTGKLQGTALSTFASEHWPGNSYALQLAEAATVREALQYLVSLPGAHAMPAAAA